MTWINAIQIVGSVMLGSFLLKSLDRYTSWKKSRPIVTASRDWRGRYVPGLKIKRIERAVITTVVSVCLFCVIYGYLVIDAMITVQHQPG